MIIRVLDGFWSCCLPTRACISFTRDLQHSYEGVSPALVHPYAHAHVYRLSCSCASCPTPHHPTLNLRSVAFWQVEENADLEMKLRAAQSASTGTVEKAVARSWIVNFVENASRRYLWAS